MRCALCETYHLPQNQVSLGSIFLRMTTWWRVFASESSLKDWWIILSRQFWAPHLQKPYIIWTWELRCTDKSSSTYHPARDFVIPLWVLRIGRPNSKYCNILLIGTGAAKVQVPSPANVYQTALLTTSRQVESVSWQCL